MTHSSNIEPLYDEPLRKELSVNAFAALSVFFTTFHNLLETAEEYQEAQSFLDEHQKGFKKRLKVKGTRKQLLNDTQVCMEEVKLEVAEGNLKDPRPILEELVHSCRPSFEELGFEAMFKSKPHPRIDSTMSFNSKNRFMNQCFIMLDPMLRISLKRNDLNDYFTEIIFAILAKSTAENILSEWSDAGALLEHFNRIVTISTLSEWYGEEVAENMKQLVLSKELATDSTEIQEAP